MDTNTVPVLDTALANLFLLIAVTMLVVTVLSVILNYFRGMRTHKANNDTQSMFAQGMEEIIDILRTQMEQNYKGVVDELQWINRVVARAMGMDQQITLFPMPSAATTAPRYLQAEGTSGRRYLISDVTPDALDRMPKPGRWPWSAKVNLRSYNPLVPLPRNTEIYRMSAINCGQMFDMEIGEIWRKHAKEELLMKEVYLYVLPAFQAGKKK